MKSGTSPASDYPYRNTAAATMLAGGLERATTTRKTSLRQLGKQLGYKQAVALSHMAKGRIPIPVERTPMLSEVLGFDQAEFLLAVLQQRYPMVAWADHFQTQSPGDRSRFKGLLAGVPLADLSADHKVVAEELVRDTHPRERWLAISEIALLSELRASRSALPNDGISNFDHPPIRMPSSNE
jgi:hypothetical protein